MITFTLYHTNAFMLRAHLENFVYDTDIPVEN